MPRLLKGLMALACLKFVVLLGWGMTLDLYGLYGAGSPVPGETAGVALIPAGQDVAFAADPPAAARRAEDDPAAYSERWERLNRKEEEIVRREQELKQLKQDLDARLAKLEDLEARLKKMLADADKLKDEKFKHLVDVYSNMKAKEAAQVMESLDHDIAVKILAGMRGRTAGSILSFVEPRKAAQLSESLTRLQMPFDR